MSEVNRERRPPTITRAARAGGRRWRVGVDTALGRRMEGFCQQSSTDVFLVSPFLVEWSTQEIWDMPNAYLTETVLYL